MTINSIIPRCRVLQNVLCKNTCRNTPAQSFQFKRTWFNMRHPSVSKRNRRVYNDEHEDEQEALPPNLSDYIPHLKDTTKLFHISELLHVGRHCNITAAGRVYSFSALVLVGNGQGTAGLGYGKALRVGNAVEKARRRAEKKAVSIYRYEDRTIPFPIYVKSGSVKVMMKPKAKHALKLDGEPRFYANLSSGHLGMIICNAFGLRDIHLSVLSHTRNVKIVLYAIWKGLILHVRSPEATARATGKKFINLTHTYFPANKQINPFNQWRVF